jgi:hypothetical protein
MGKGAKCFPGSYIDTSEKQYEIKTKDNCEQKAMTQFQ